MAAAKTAQRNSRRCKARLVRKAGKRSPADLERIAVFKRCGLCVSTEDDAEEPVEGTSAASGRSSSCHTPAPAGTAIGGKLHSALHKISGAAQFLQTMNDTMSSTVGAAADAASTGSGALVAGGPLPRVAVGSPLLLAHRRSYGKLESSPASGRLRPGDDVGAHVSDIERVHGEDMDG